MKNQITIKRSGCFLPTFALVVIFLLVSALLWLSTVGLPKSVLTDWENKVREETGLFFSVQKIRLSPLHGLGITAEGVNLSGAGLPNLSAEKINLSFGWDDIAVGRFDLPDLRIRDGLIFLPIEGSPNEVLSLEQLRLHAEVRCPQGENQLHLNVSGILQGVNLNLAVITRLPETQGESTEPVDIKENIATVRAKIHTVASTLKKAHDTIAEQHWEKAPNLLVQFSTEDKRPHLNVIATLPGFEWRNIHVRDAKLSAAIHGPEITLNTLSFKTVDPNTSFAANAECNMDSLQGAFNLLSSASPVDIAQKHLGKGSPQWLQQIHHDPGVTPSVRLKGDIQLAGDNEIIRQCADVFHAQDINELAARISILLPKNTKATYIDELCLMAEELHNGGRIKPGCFRHTGAMTKAAGFRTTWAHQLAATGSAVQPQLHSFRISDITSESPSVSLSQVIAGISKLAEHLRIEGEIEQRGFTVNDSKIKAVEAGFYYEDGNFNLDKVRITLPDNGQISLSAYLKDGQGEAMVGINSDVDFLLHFANHFTPVTLPKGVELRGKTALKVQLKLNTPQFVPGETELQDMIPHLTALSADMNIGHVAAMGAVAEHPSIVLNAKGLNHPFNQLSECSIGEWELSAAAEYFSYNQAAATDFRLFFNGRDISVAQSKDDVCVAAASATGEFSAAETTYNDASLKGVELTAEAPYGWSCDKPVLQQLRGLHLHLDSSSFAIGDDFSGERLTTDAAVEAPTQAAALKLATTINGEELTLHLPCTITEDSVTLNNVHLSCPVAELEPLLQRFVGEDYSVVAKHLQLPKEIQLHVLGGGYNFEKNRLTDTIFSLSVPQLVRTPNAVPALRGKDVAVGINTILTLSQNDEGELLYNGHVQVTHESGQLNADVDGNIASDVHVTNGRNTIFADAIDLLIDDEDAHAIIRDFRFTPGKSKILADDIDTTVSYDNGICVEVKCNADIIDTEYLLDAYTEQEEDGIVREVYQEGVTADTFTLFQHAHCGVEVNVLLDRKDENGNPLADEQTIKLTNVELTSNNSRWFTQNNMGGKGLKTSTTIKGESILFNIENNTLTLSGLKGDSYPAYTIGTFYLPLRDYLSGILLTAPAQLETKEVVVPIATHCDVPMSGTIRVKIPNGGRYDLQGTIIPVEQFSGFVTLFDDHVYLDKLNAATWGGVLNGQLSIGFNDKLPAFDGYFVARAMDLRRIAKAFDSDFKPAVCGAEFRFRAKNAELTSLEGYGAARVSDGDLMEIPLFSPVSYVITHLPEFIADKATDSVRRVTGRKVTKETPAPQQEKEEEKSWWQRVTGVFTNPVRSVTSAVNYSADAAADKANSVQDAAGAYIPFANYVATYDLQDASAFFTLRNGFLYSDDVKASGSNLKVKLEMALNLTNMTINATLHPSFNSLLDVAAMPFTELSKHMLDINVSGPLSNLSWSVHLNNSEAIKKQMKDDVERLKKEAKDVEHAIGL